MRSLGRQAYLIYTAIISQGRVGEEMLGSDAESSRARFLASLLLSVTIANASKHNRLVSLSTRSIRLCYV